MAAAVVSLAASSVQAQPQPPRTFVALSGSTDDHPRLGNPAIHVEVLSAAAELGERLARVLTTDLDVQVYARPDRGDAPYDYRLEVRIDPPPASAPGDPIRFTATMESPERGVVWRTEGRTEISGRGVDDEIVGSISSNLVSALVHDRWVARRLDPDDPPPPAPTVHPPE
jgi:hypothetical protein